MEALISLITYPYNAVVSIFENMGWYLLLVVIALVYLYNRAKPHINKYLEFKAERDYAAKYHKDPDLLAARLTAQQIFSQKLQEKYDKDAEEFKKKMEEKEAKKREEWTKKLEESGPLGGKLGSSTSFKPDYNPLMGDSSRGYRAPKKSGCGGGSCGK